MLDVLDGVSGGNLPLAQFGTFEERFLGHARQLFIQLGDLANPLAEGLGRRQCVLDFRVVEQLALGHIDRDHLTRAQRALFDDLRFLDVDHSRLRAC